MTEAPPGGPDGRLLAELAGLFLKLGATAFGGPATHVALMEDEVVRRRQWLIREELLDLLGATNLIPGPNSTELAIHIGHRRAGWRGLLVAGVCFITPAALRVTVIGWAYVRFGKLPQAEGVLYGVKPVIIAVVLQALRGLGRTARKTGALAAMGGTPLFAFLPALPLAATTSTASAVAAPFGLGPMFLFFLKVGSVLFGSGDVHRLSPCGRSRRDLKRGWRAVEKTSRTSRFTQDGKLGKRPVANWRLGRSSKRSPWLAPEVETRILVTAEGARVLNEWQQSIRMIVYECSWNSPPRHPGPGRRVRGVARSFSLPGWPAAPRPTTEAFGQPGRAGHDSRRRFWRGARVGGPDGAADHAAVVVGHTDQLLDS